MRRICILGASLHTGNMGVSALASGAVGAALHADPEAEVSFFDYGYEPTRQNVQLESGTAEVDLVNVRFSKKVWLRNNIALLLAVATVSRFCGRKLGARWRARYPSLSALLKADVVASLSGGDSFSDVYGLGRLLYVALPQILALQLGKPLVLLPQTLGPFQGRIARALARYIIDRAAIVYGRDRRSLLETSELMGTRSWKPRFAYDMAFVMAPAPASERLDRMLPSRTGGEPLVGINVSGLLAMGGYDRRNMFGLKGDYMRLVEEIAIHFAGRLRANVLLVPHVLGDAPESDRSACREIHRRLAQQLSGRVHVLNEDLDQHEIKYVIGRCDFFISSRMHACIAALSQHVPAVSLAYSRKFVGVMESLKLPELVVDLTKVDGTEAMERVCGLFNDRSRIRRELEAQIPEVKRRVYAVLDGDARAAAFLECDRDSVSLDGVGEPRGA